MNDDTHARINAVRARQQSRWAYPQHPIIRLHHRDGVDWFDALVPRRWHRCSPQTWGYDARLIERCACGAIRLDGNGPWMERNSRRRKA